MGCKKLLWRRFCYFKGEKRWEDAQGRFFLRFFDYWRDSMIVPELIVFLSILMMVGAVYLVWEILDIHSTVQRILIGGFILFAPSVANLFTYYYCADAYSLAFLFSVVAAYILIKGRNNSFNIIVASIIRNVVQKNAI